MRLHLNRENEKIQGIFFLIFSTGLCTVGESEIFTSDIHCQTSGDTQRDTQNTQIGPKNEQEIILKLLDHIYINYTKWISKHKCNNIKSQKAILPLKKLEMFVHTKIIYGFT